MKVSRLLLSFSRVVLLCLFLVPSFVFAQQGWYPVTNSLLSYGFSVTLANSNTAFAVGELGRMRKSTDGGVSWSQITTGTNVWLRGVSFSDLSTGLAVGDYGNIIRTTDGGVTWTRQVSGTTHDLFGIRFVTPLIAIAVGGSGTLLRSENGGVTWTGGVSNTTEELRAISFADPATGVAVGGFMRGAVIRTTDYGVTWTPVSIGSVQVLYAVSLCNSQAGVAAGLSGTLLVTTNGGASWSPQSGQSANFFGAECISSNIMTVVGSVILRSTDGALTWRQQPGSGISVAFSTPDHGIVVGTNSILWTTTGGNYGWEVRESGTATNLRAISYMNSAVGVAVGDSGTITRTTDAGYSWAIRPSGTFHNLSGISFSQNTGIAVGDSGSVLRSEDGGFSWVATNQGTGRRLRSVSFASASTVVATGDSGIMLRSTNDGLTWSLTQLPFPQHIISVSFANENIGVAVAVPQLPFGGGTQRILRTTDGGTSWTDTLVLASVVRLQAVSLNPSGVGYAVGGIGTSGVMLRTSDFGMTWSSEMFPAAGGGFRGVAFRNELNILVVGNGWIYRTTDGGNSWDLQGPGGGLVGAAILEQGKATTVGESGKILWTDTDGVYLSVRNRDPGIASNLILEQNYPNPFNPSTTIRFSLPSAAYVELGILNILGQRVATLVSEDRSAGSHAVTWNPHGYASGIYFYRIISGGHAVTRKLMLLR